MLRNCFFELFYSFYILVVFLVVIAKTPIHAVLGLVFVFCLSGFMLIFLDVTFLACLLLQIYVGAILVLFLFCVMMFSPLSVNTLQKSKKKDSFTFLPFLLFFFLLTLDIFLPILSVVFLPLSDLIFEENIFFFEEVSSIYEFGFIFYTHFGLVFILLGLVLFLALLGSILLTLPFQEIEKKQEI